MALLVPRVRMQSRERSVAPETDYLYPQEGDRKRESQKNVVKVGNQECVISLAPGPIAELAAEPGNKAAN